MTTNEKHLRTLLRTMSLTPLTSYVDTCAKPCDSKLTTTRRMAEWIARFYYMTHRLGTFPEDEYQERHQTLDSAKNYFNSVYEGEDGREKTNARCEAFRKEKLAMAKREVALLKHLAKTTPSLKDMLKAREMQVKALSTITCDFEK